MARLSATGNAAYDALLAELENPRAAMIADRDEVPEDIVQKATGLGGRLSAMIRDYETGKRYEKHLEPEVGFVERLVLFWANHFSINNDKNEKVKALQGHFERTVIRANVLGNFGNMLEAAIKHPAMLEYLDNIDNHKDGIIENLAREILELHTVGTKERFPERKAQYEQKDVEALSRVLTGWTRQLSNTIWLTGRIREYGRFYFNPAMHHDGPHRIIDFDVPSTGVAQGEATLKWLADHSYTAQHICYKLLRHFVCDEPTPSMVNILRHSFWFYRNHPQQLKIVATHMLRMGEAWTKPPRLRPPHLWVVSVSRALDFTVDDFMTRGFRVNPLLRQDDPFTDPLVSRWRILMRLMNNEPWKWITPDGYPDGDSDWNYPDAIRNRILLANQVQVDLDNRGRRVSDHVQLRARILPDSVASDERVLLRGLSGDDVARARVADLFLTTAFMTR